MASSWATAWATCANASSSRPPFTSMYCATTCTFSTAPRAFFSCDSSFLYHFRTVTWSENEWKFLHFVQNYVFDQKHYLNISIKCLNTSIFPMEFRESWSSAVLRPRWRTVPSRSISTRTSQASRWTTSCNVCLAKRLTASCSRMPASKTFLFYKKINHYSVLMINDNDQRFLEKLTWHSHAAWRPWDPHSTHIHSQFWWDGSISASGTRHDGRANPPHDIVAASRRPHLPPDSARLPLQALCAYSAWGIAPNDRRAQRNDQSGMWYSRWIIMLL